MRRYSLALLVAFVACSWAACSGRSDSVTVCAAASLRELVTEVGDAWSRDAGIVVAYRFDASDLLARQIREGAPADLFLSADPSWIDEVQAIDTFAWIGNRLVAVRRRGSAVDDLATVESLALGSEGSPIGRYSAAALRALGVTPPARTIFGANVRDVLHKVAEGAADAGIVYATDVAIDSRVEVFVALPAEVQPKIVYPVALLSERGRPLFEVFRSANALDAARRRGFTAP